MNCSSPLQVSYGFPCGTGKGSAIVKFVCPSARRTGPADPTTLYVLYHGLGFNDPDHLSSVLCHKNWLHADREIGGGCKRNDENDHGERKWFYLQD